MHNRNAARESIAMLLLGFSIALAVEPDQKKRLLPGMQAGGSVLLPNQWSLRPVGRQIEVGDFPVNMVIHPSGDWLIVLHAGFGEHELMSIDLKSNRIASRVAIPQTFYGLTLSNDGSTVFCSGGEYSLVHRFGFGDGLFTAHSEIPIAHKSDKSVIGGVAVIGDAEKLLACAPWGDYLTEISLSDTSNPRFVEFERESFPYAILPSKNSEEVFVSLWNKAMVVLVDLKSMSITKQFPTERHPTEMALTGNGKTLLVACANSTRVSEIDLETGKGLETISCALYPAAPNGNTPSSLTLVEDGKTLIVANADANNLALVNVATAGKAKPMGFVPVGWYPTCVRFNPKTKKIYVANGKGLTSRANPQGPNPNQRALPTLEQYIGRLFKGTISIIDFPTPDQIVSHSRQAYACSPLRADAGVSAAPPEGNPIPSKPGQPSPIKHCVYIIKENRTYDQVFGDMPQGNGDPNLCLFPEKVTPNHHRLAREFVLLDNFYVEGEVSADGHMWTMGAYATDFVEKVWPLSYRGSPRKKLGYPSEGDGGNLANPAGGYLWDRCAEAGVTYRSYGEWVSNGPKPGMPGKARSKNLEGHFDPLFRSFDMNYLDVKRADRFIEELNKFEKEGNLPQCVILRLPNDHTQGAAVGALTPTAYLADNDLALGRVVEALTKSQFWKQMAIFVIEDDAQNGPDHVDAHRTVALAISPYIRRHSVDSTFYSTSSMLRTMELILGLKPMSQFDAAARPMYASFQNEADFTIYEHVNPAVDMDERNRSTAWGAELSRSFDFAKEDAADDLLLNEVVWRSVKGADSRMPPPVRSAFVFTHPEEDDEDDDD